MKRLALLFVVHALACLPLLAQSSGDILYNTKNAGAGSTLRSLTPGTSTDLLSLNGSGLITRTAQSTFALASHNQAWSTITSTPTTLAGYGITDAITAATAASTYQPLDSDLTSIAALSTTTFGRSFLTMANADAAQIAIGLTTGFDTGYITINGNLVQIDGSGITAPAFTGDGSALENLSATNITSGTLADARLSANVSLLGSSIALGSEVAGTLPIANGGTGQTTASAARIALLPSMTGNGGKFLRVNAGATDYELATISGGGDALTTSPLSQFAATTSAQLAGVISDETGSGALVFGTSPTLTTPALGTPSSITLTNATGLPLSTGITGTLAITNGGTGQTSQTAAFDAMAPTTTKGDLIVHNGTDNIRVPVGATNGHVLTVDSAEASGVKWAAASGGGSGGNWVLISTTTISGSPSTLDFTFSGSYRKYRLELENVYCSSDGFDIRMRTSTDGGSTFDSGASNYGYAYGPHGTYGPVSTTGTYIETSQSLVGSATDEGLWGEIEFYDPLNASLKTFARWIIFGRIYNSAAANVITGAGYRDSAADVDTVQLYFSSGNFAGGKIRLFGWSE